MWLYSDTMSGTYTTITVTQEDIDRALRRKSGRCVVATAVARSIPDATRVEVDLQTIRFSAEGERRVYLTPPAASGYVIAFDAGDDIHPFAFRLSERHRVNVRQDKRTPAAKERIRTRARIAKAEHKLGRAQVALEQLLEEDEPDPGQVAAATKKVKDSARQVRTTKSTHRETQLRLEGEPYIDPDMTPDPDTGERRPKPPARAFKTSTRSYGSRQLRINQGRNTAEHQAARNATMAVYNEWSDSEPFIEPEDEDY